MTDALPPLVEREHFDTCPVMPCPFCGEANEFTVHLDITVDPDSGEGLSSIGCGACGGEGPFVVGGEAGAMAAWNKRWRVQ